MKTIAKNIIKNFNFKDCVIVGLIMILIWNLFFSSWDKEKNIKVEPVTITLPAIDGTTGKIKVEPEIITETIYLPQYKEKVVVDKTYKNLYNNAKDSIEKLNLYLDAIKINEYDKTIINNDTIKIIGKVKTRGDLLEYKIDYKIKPVKVTYIPEVIVKKPTLMGGVSGELGIPTTPDNFIFKGNLNIINQKGNSLSIGYDTEKKIWVGIGKSIIIKK